MFINGYKISKCKIQETTLLFFSVTSHDQKPQIEAKTCGEDRRDAVSLQDYILYQKHGYFYLSIDQMIM